MYSQYPPPSLYAGTSTDRLGGGCGLYITGRDNCCRYTNSSSVCTLWLCSTCVYSTWSMAALLGQPLEYLI